jgi:hypothetical protein
MGVFKIINKISFLIIGLIFLLIISSLNSIPGLSNEYIKENNIKYILKGNPTEPFLSQSWYNKPTNYSELVSWYISLESEYPDYLEVFKANELYNTGKVTGGYDIYFVRITNEDLGLHKPEVLLVGGPHGNENVGHIGLYWFTDWLMRMAYTNEPCEEYSKEWLKWIIDNREIYIEVCHNPYGFDHGPQRHDANGWDINRECDYDGPGIPTGGIWASVNGKTLREFVNHHLIRSGFDGHDGVRMFFYPWSSNHENVFSTSPITGKIHSYCPPDYFYFDAASLRVCDYIGDYGGDFDVDSIGPPASTILYEAPGAIMPWAYGSDVEKNPVEDPYVEDEIFGNYPGSGILWFTPEFSLIKSPPEYTYGNDTIHRFGAEVRRLALFLADIAQPYLLWQSGTVENNEKIDPGSTIQCNWQVNGSLVVDHTYIQWGTNPDPINNFEFTTTDYDEHDGDYYGGTGWDDAESGTTNGVTYSENITLETTGDYYFVAKAKVDQVYTTLLHPEIYGNTSYLRIIKERTDDNYYEILEGTDGIEEINGQTWWYSPIIHVRVMSNPPNKPIIDGPPNGNVGEEYYWNISAVDTDGDDIMYIVDWGDGETTETDCYSSGIQIQVYHTYSKQGSYTIKVKAKDCTDGLESDWSELKITMPKTKISINTFILRLLENFPNINQLLIFLLLI